MLNKKVFLLLIYIILDYIFASNFLFVCTDHDSYASMFDVRETQIGFINNLGIDRFHYLFIQFLNPRNYKDYFLQFHILSNFIFCFGVFNLRKIITFNETLLILLTPILFSIVYPHLWMCGYRSGIATSFIFLIFTYIYKQNYYSRKINIIYFIFLISLALNAHWTSLFLIPFILSGEIYIFLKKVLKKIIDLKLNKLFFISLCILISAIFYLTTYTFSLDHLVSKVLVYSFQDLFRESYGVKIPKLLFFAYLPQIILRLNKKFIMKNKNIKGLNFSSLDIVFVSSFLSFFGVGGYLIRAYLPLTLIASSSNFIFYRYLTKLGKIAVIFSSFILFLGSIYYLFSLSNNIILIDNYYRGLSKALFR